MPLSTEIGLGIAYRFLARQFTPAGFFFEHRCRASFQDLILECHAFGVIFLEPCFRGVDVCEYLEMIDVTDLLARVDVDEDCHFCSS